MDKQQQALLDIWPRLSAADRRSLLDYAQFLAGRQPSPAVQSAVATTPLPVPRPQEESVIAAVKRLSQTYPMLNKDNMLHETSGLVAQHLLQGRPAGEVIDELEAVFRRNYARWQAGEAGPGQAAVKEPSPDD